MKNLIPCLREYVDHPRSWEPLSEGETKELVELLGAALGKATVRLVIYLEQKGR